MMVVVVVVMMMMMMMMMMITHHYRRRRCHYTLEVDVTEITEPEMVPFVTSPTSTRH